MTHSEVRQAIDKTLEEIDFSEDLAYTRSLLTALKTVLPGMQCEAYFAGRVVVVDARTPDRSVHVHVETALP